MQPPDSAPLILPYEGVQPVLQGPLAHAGSGSAVLGRVTLGAGAVLQAFATLRGDGQAIHVGPGLFMGPHATVHIAHALHGTAIGARVSVGRHAVVHACTVEDDCVVQDGACILDGARVGAGSVVAAGSVVFSRAVLPAGHWCEGSPAVAMRPIGLVELRALHADLRDANQAPEAMQPAVAPMAVQAQSTAYVAPTARVGIPLQMADGTSLWFGCVLRLAQPGVASPGLRLEAGANVQDNSVVCTGPAGLHIGAECTVGHNVRLHDGRIGSQVLIGMGSTLAPGTVVQDRVLLAAGSSTEPGQVLESGWLWGGRTARALSKLDERKLDLMRRSALNYRSYARGFGAAARAGD